MLRIKPKDQPSLSIAEFNEQTPLDNAKLSRLLEMMMKDNPPHPSQLAYVITGENVKKDAYSYEYQEAPIVANLIEIEAELVAEIDFDEQPDSNIFYDKAKQQLFYIQDDEVKVLYKNVSKIEALKNFEKKYASAYWNIRWNTQRSLDL